MSNLNPSGTAERPTFGQPGDEEINIFDILETLLQGWKQIAVFLALGLLAAGLWVFIDGRRVEPLPEPLQEPPLGTAKLTLELAWPPLDLPNSFSLNMPANRRWFDILGLDETPWGAARNNYNFGWSPAVAISRPELKAAWASFEASLAEPVQKALDLEGLKLESMEAAKLAWSCEADNEITGLKILNDLADQFEQHFLKELGQLNSDRRVGYETSLAAVEKVLGGHKADLAALRKTARNIGESLPGDKHPAAGRADRENDLMMDIAFQEAQKARWRYLVGQLPAIEAAHKPQLGRISSWAIPEPAAQKPAESRRVILVKAAGLVGLALALGCASVLVTGGWRQHRAKRQRQASAGAGY